MKFDRRFQIRVPRAILDAVTSIVRVTDPHHALYKYPARFSPEFAREVIQAFTKPGDTVLDPFCGGGTSLVEAMAAGRKAAGFDISSLATFLSKTKLSPISSRDKKEMMGWLEKYKSRPKRESVGHAVRSKRFGSDSNLPRSARIFFKDALTEVSRIESSRQKKFIRLSLLAVGQSLFDCKAVVPSVREIKARFCDQLERHIDDQYAFLTKVARTTGLPRCKVTTLRRVVNRPSEECSGDGRIPQRWLPAKLVLTSPPYPGVHVVYHRWQVNGRRETAVPFVIADSRDGAGEAYYCLGARSQPGLSNYFRKLRNSFAAVRTMVGPGSLLVQLVAFSEPAWQLPTYLNEMTRAGFAELAPLCADQFLFQGRVWRDVPGRKWYATNQGLTGGSREVLLFHRPV